MSDDVLANLAEALVVRPGDTLIVRLTADTSPEQLMRFRENAAAMFTEKLPDVEVIYLGGVEQLAVYRPEQLVFVTIEWDGADGRASEAFGPWTSREDGSHLDELGEFLRRWRDAEAKPGASFIVWAPTSPDAYEQRVART